MGKSSDYWAKRGAEFRKELEDARQAKLNSEIDINLRMIENARNHSLTRKIQSANTLSTQEYKKEVAEANKKRKIKNSPNKTKGMNIPKRIVAALVAASITIGGGVLVSEAIDSHNEAKEERFAEALSALKEQIAESVGTTPDKIKVYNKSSITSSVSEIEEYVVAIGGRTYRYRVPYVEGVAGTKIDEIKNPNVIEAIKIISNAQDGNYWESKDAEELAEKIKSGEIDLSMEQAVEARLAEEKERY